MLLLAKLLKVLNAEAAPGQISAALCLALFFAFMPMITLQHLIVLLLVLVLRVNLTGFLLGWLVFSGVGFVLDPLFHRLGLALLSADFLHGFWTLLYGSAFWHLTRFTNTVVTGGFVVTLILVLPLYFGANAAIVKYRDHFMSWIEKTRLVQMVKASRIYSAYRTVSGWRGSV